MRLVALLPLALCATSLILAFLCLFAGSSKGFMENFDLLTLNTSRLGQNLFDTSEHSDNFFVELWDNITNTIESEVEDIIGSVAKEIGIHDFYSTHLMNFCEGYYTPSALPNATLPKSKIAKNITACSRSRALYAFNPTQILQDELDKSGTGIQLPQLKWPENSIETGLDTLRRATRAAFVLYCVAIALIGVAVMVGIAGVFLAGRLSVAVNLVVEWLAFFVLAIASAVSTAIGIRTSHIINRYRDVGISMTVGRRFLVITWIATVLLLLASVGWCLESIVSARRTRRHIAAAKARETEGIKHG